MTREKMLLEQRRQQAITELQGMIRAKYPAATFAVCVGPEDPQETWLTARVDLDDPEEIMDVVLDRVLELQIEEGIPAYVLPLRTPERRAALRCQLTKQRQKVSMLPHLPTIRPLIEVNHRSGQCSY